MTDTTPSHYVPSPVADEHSYIAVHETTADSLPDTAFILEFVGPTRHHVTPVTIDSWLEVSHPVTAHGASGTVDGRIYTLDSQQQTPNAVTLGEIAAQYAFAYWWSLNYDGFTPAIQPGESYGDRQNRLDVVSSVEDDGTLTLTDGTTHSTPYARSQIKSKTADNWDTPTERCTETLNDTLETLLGKYPEHVVHAAHENSIDCLTYENKERATKARETLSRALENTPGVGPSTKDAIEADIGSLEGLCEDLQHDTPILSDISGVGNSTISNIRDTVEKTDTWDETL